ncbi:MAG: Hsp20 family protein [Sphaerobacter sp.]|nr:Hsp20 family protein [Sphaerobacter sp.]
MSIMSWDPWSSALALRETVDRLLGSPLDLRIEQMGGTAIDLRDEGDAYVVTAALPGARPEDIELRITGQLLEIAGETRAIPEGEATGRWLLREREAMRVERVVRLPAPVDVDQAEARCELGVLTVRLPKAVAMGARHIPVRTTAGARAAERAAPAVEEEGVGHVQPRRPPTSASPERVPVTGTTPSSPPEPTGTAAAPSRPADRTQVQAGMEVVGPDGGHIGLVKEVREGDLLVDRKLQRDVYVPFDAVRSVESSRVVLTVPPGQVDAMHWEHPPLAQ